MNHTSRPVKKHFTVSMSEALHNYIMNNEMWSVLEINLVNVNVFKTIIFKFQCHSTHPLALWFKKV